MYMPTKPKLKLNQRWETLKTKAQIALAAFFTVALIFAIVMLPTIMITHRNLSLAPKDQLDAEAAIRSSFIQMVAGMVLIAGLYFTARGFRLTREGHITDRYSKAVEHLGNENPDVRIGGIYALERIMRDSVNDKETIVDVLATFVREHTKSGHRKPSIEKVTADVQAALNVIGRRPDIEKESTRLDFYHSGLNDADLSSADFRNAMFYYSQLDGASFSGSQLQGAGLSFCTARGAAFTNSNARGANFVNASDLLPKN
jgi:hypothetical protein